jgi:hypothetical protein
MPTRAQMGALEGLYAMNAYPARVVSGGQANECCASRVAWSAARHEREKPPRRGEEAHPHSSA